MIGMQLCSLTAISEQLSWNAQHSAIACTSQGRVILQFNAILCLSFCSVQKVFFLLFCILMLRAHVQRCRLKPHETNDAGVRASMSRLTATSTRPCNARSAHSTLPVLHSTTTCRSSTCAWQHISKAGAHYSTTYCTA